MLRVATCQFPTCADVDDNADHIAALMRDSAGRDAHLAHFCEGALSGYVPSDLASTDEIDWARLQRRTQQLCALAGELGIWLVVGSTHRLTPPHRPHNSVYVVDPRGELVDRYDKRFCAGAGEGQGELASYSPGDHHVDLEVQGVRATIHVCHEYRYPELVRDAKRRGVSLILHSFHAAGVDERLLLELQATVAPEHRAASRGATLPEITMPASMIAAAASSHVWASCPNSAAPQSCFGSFFVRADGVVTGQLERHATGLLVSTVDLDEPLYDSTRAWREGAITGQRHSGSLVDDPRSRDRTSL